MTEVLIVTLGNSPDSIINCINSLRPDRVIFLCSHESQQDIETVRSKVPLADFVPERDVVVLQQRLGSKQSDAVTNELDQLDRVYLRAQEIFERVRNEAGGCRIIADYTGGTKTMTTGLAMAAIDDGKVRLHLTITDRSPGESAVSGYSSPVAVNTAAIHGRRLRQQELPSLLKRHDYEAARQAVRRVQSLGDQDQDTTVWLKGLEDLLVSLDAWDRFDHRQALVVLESLNDRRFDQLLLFPLKRVIGSRRLLDKQADEQKVQWLKGHGLEAVEDLMHNAERRATQERYDDAVGRLYRAMELTAQLLLKIAVTDKVGPSGIDTGNVDLDRLPDEVQPQWREKAARNNTDGAGAKLKIGLTDSFDLLADLCHPTGLLWKNERATFVNTLSIRNKSLFAHGFEPIGYSGWRELSQNFGSFLHQAIDDRRTSTGDRTDPLPQLPSCLAELDPSQ